MTYEIANPQKATRGSRGKCACDQNVRVFKRQTQRVLVGKIHVGFIQNQDSTMRAAKLFQFVCGVTSPAGGIRSRDERKRRLEVPRSGALQLFHRGQTKIALQRYGL